MDSTHGGKFNDTAKESFLMDGLIDGILKCLRAHENSFYF